jgi:hypothetical protein
MDARIAWIFLARRDFVEEQHGSVMASGPNQHLDDISLLFVATMKLESRKNMARRSGSR